MKTKALKKSNPLNRPNVFFRPGYHRIHGKLSYPVFPSASVTVAQELYMEALESIHAKIECVFCDGETFVLPEYEVDSINLLVKRFNGTVEYGCAREAEYCTLANRAGVSLELILLGHDVQSRSGISPQEMVELALKEPETAKATWNDLQEFCRLRKIAGTRITSRKPIMLSKEYCEALQAMKDQASAATAQLVANDPKAKRAELADAQRRMALHDKEMRTIYRLLMGSGDKTLTIDTLDECRLAQELGFV